MISIESEFEIVPQLSVADLPEEMFTGDAVNEAIVGVPLHLGGATMAEMTVILTWRVATFEPHRAVNVYVVICEGVTWREPGVATPPIPGSISTESAFVTAPQLSVTALPGDVFAADEVNEAMFGVPPHFGAAGALTVIATWRVIVFVPQRAVKVYVVVCAGGKTPRK